MTPTIKTQNNDIGVVEQKEQLRIRKLTPRECGRLQCVAEQDITNMSMNLSNSALYHCFGDSIAIFCLMGIFGELLDINWKQKIQNQINQIKD